MLTPHRVVGLLALALALVAPQGSAAAQVGTVAVDEENFRVAPEGPVLAQVLRGTPLALGAADGRWRQATLEGWVWAPSVREERRDGHDLVVSAAGGENLRATPNGTRIARLRAGMRLERVEARDRWVRVRRTAWIWQPSLDVAGPPAARPADTPAGEPATPDDTAAGAPPSAAPAPAARPVPGGGPAREFVRAAAGGAAVLTSPTGDTLARVRPAGSVEVLAREGDWVRVRIEGWALRGELGAPDTTGGGVVADIGRQELQAEPERYRGSLVEWVVQFIALQQAERFRTDFIEGEHFLLTRGPGEDPGFVYVAVPPERLEEARALAPLQRLRILARVRSARSALTGAPVLDLLEITTPGR